MFTYTEYNTPLVCVELKGFTSRELLYISIRHMYLSIHGDIIGANSPGQNRPKNKGNEEGFHIPYQN